MDPLTHVVVGRAVVAAAERHERAPRGVAAAAILGALSPDIDAAVAFSGWDRYVRIHEIGTHSIAGALVMACLTAGVVRAVGRFRDRYGDPEPPSPRLRRSAEAFREGGRIALRLPLPAFGVLFAAATAGAFSHLILDLACGGRIRLGWPLLQDRVTMPLVAMADPWLIAICVAGLLALWPGRRPLRLVSRTIVGSAIVLLAMKGALLARALRSSPVAVSMPAIEAHWGSLSEWSALERTSEAVRAWTISGAGGSATLSMSHPLGPDTPLVRASRSLEAVQNFLSVHDFVFAVERPANLGRTEVLWSDLRYCWPPFARESPERASAGQAPGARESPEQASAGQAPGARELPERASARQDHDDSIACGVWVGGLFGTDTLALTQLVKIGRVVQTRPVRP
jgi:membrane-bound metal-dependent hydrolase YbcI (DUF457 family)